VEILLHVTLPNLSALWPLLVVTFITLTVNIYLRG
jgi:hypothetical protein